MSLIQKFLMDNIFDTRAIHEKVLQYTSEGNTNKVDRVRNTLYKVSHVF